MSPLLAVTGPATADTFAERSFADVATFRSKRFQLNTKPRILDTGGRGLTDRIRGVTGARRALEEQI